MTTTPKPLSTDVGTMSPLELARFLTDAILMLHSVSGAPEFGHVRDDYSRDFIDRCLSGNDCFEDLKHTVSTLTTKEA